MRFTFSILALSSLAVLVAANSLVPRQAKCSSTPQCCTLLSLDDDDTRALLKNASIPTKGLTGMVATGCGPAPTTDTEEPCSDDKIISCCPATQPSTTVSVNCTSMAN